MTSHVMAPITSPGHAALVPTMDRFRPLFLLVAVAFTAYSTLVVLEHGYTGFLTVASAEPWAMQMLVDLALSLLIVSSVLAVDARRRGVKAWPWLLATVLLGSVGPLWYLALRRSPAR